MKARMVSRGAGRLVGLSSVAGARGLPGAAVYSATKAALRIYLEGLTVESRKHGVDVTTIAPGFIATAPNLKHDRPMPFLMQVEPASEAFVRGIVAGKRWIVAPWQFRIVTWLLKHLPDFAYQAAGRFL
jgi:short-subunit dehydrogenase